jgi:TonB family protein
LRESNWYANSNLMSRISNKLKMLLFLPFISLTVYSQDKNSKDTATNIILCQSSVSYPDSAEYHKISGTVVVLFDIDSNCRVVNIRIEKNIGYGCDEEAIKALKKCKPIFNGTKKNCTPIFNLRQPFTFKYQDDD